MYSIIAGTILLGIIHALIPNHWLPLVAVAKTEKWTKSEVFFASSISASAHVLGTIIIGTILGFIGTSIAHKYEEDVHIIAPLLIIVFGLIYCSMNNGRHFESVDEKIPSPQRSKRKVILIFVLMMFLSPCLEVQSLFLAIGVYGSDAILLLGLVYSVASVFCILLFTMLAFRGFDLINSAFVTHHEKRITGIVLIVVGIVTFYAH